MHRVIYEEDKDQQTNNNTQTQHRKLKTQQHEPTKHLGAQLVQRDKQSL